MRRAAAAALVALVGVSLVGLPARAASPGKGTLSAAAPKVAWRGTAHASNPAGCPTSTDPTCDHFLLTIDPVAGMDVRITVDVGADDFDVAVYGPDGKKVAGGQGGFTGEDEVAVIPAPKKGTYEVAVQPFFVVPGATYKAVAAFVGATATSSGGSGSGSGGSGDSTTDTEAPCGEDLPAEMSPGLTDDPGGKVKLSVLLLLDGVDAKAAAAVAKKAAKSYAPMDVVFSVDAMRPVALAPDKGGDTAKASRLIDDARKLVGGRRPKGFDVVYVLTTKDIYEDVLGSSVVGLADCIGGIRDPLRAFAVGEVDDDEFDLLGAARMYVDSTAKIFAHEIGHLLGAKHDYANCVEGVEASDVSGREVSPCTLMSNFVDFQSLKFDVVNAAIVRGHASSDARP